MSIIEFPGGKIHHGNGKLTVMGTDIPGFLRGAEIRTVTVSEQVFVFRMTHTYGYFRCIFHVRLWYTNLRTTRT